jgi:hypothetical protein
MLSNQEERLDSTANDIAGLHGIGPGKLKGSARGALICVSFGSGWMYWAVVLSGSQSPVWFSMVTLPAVALMLWAVLRVRAFRRLASSPAERAHWKRFRKFFWIDFGAEWGLAGIAAFFLAHVRRSDLIPQAVGAIVGLHFLPLAKSSMRGAFTGQLVPW